MHHVSYDVEDMPLDKLLPSIARESHSVCMLTVSFAELSDVGCRKFLEEIEPHAHWRRLQPGDRIVIAGTDQFDNADRIRISGL